MNGTLESLHAPAIGYSRFLTQFQHLRYCMYQLYSTSLRIISLFLVKFMGFFNLIIMNCHHREFKIKTWPILVCAHISSDMKVSMFGWHAWRIRKTIRQFKLYPHENKNFQVIMTPWIFMAITLFIAQSAKSLIIKFSVSSTQYTAVNMNTYWMYVHSIKSSWHSVTHQYIQ